MSGAHRWFLGAAVVLGCLFGSSVPAFSQVFLPPKGEGSVSVVVQQGLILYHLIPDAEFRRGSIRWNTVYVDFTYGLGERVALNVTLPWVRSKYDGATAHCQVDQDPCPQRALGLDNGSYHGEVQDIHAILLYGLKTGGVTITPFAGGIIPSHEYAYFNHAAAGRRLFEAEFGAGIARRLDPVLPDAYVQARYSFGIPQRVLGMWRNRSNLSVEAGYLIKHSWQVAVNASGQYTHGGLDCQPITHCGFPWETWTHHDQIGRDHFLHVGAGTEVWVTDSLGLFASVVRAVAGHNGHKIDYVWSVGVSRSVGTGRASEVVPHIHR